MKIRLCFSPHFKFKLSTILPDVSPFPAMIPRLLFAQTSYKGLVRFLKLQTQLSEAGCERSFGFYLHRCRKSPPSLPPPSTIIIPRSPFAQMPTEGLARSPLPAQGTRSESTVVHKSFAQMSCSERVEKMPIGGNNLKGSA